MNPVTKIILWILAVSSFLACGYSFLGVMMVAMLAAGPNYSYERAQFNVNFWGSCTIIFFLLSAFFSALCFQSYFGGVERRKRKSSPLEETPTNEGLFH